MDKKNYELFDKLLQKKCTPEELSRLEEYLQDTSQEELDQVMKEFWHSEGEPANEDIKQDLRRSLFKSITEEKFTRTRRKVQPVLWVAAIVVGVLFLLTSLYFNQTEEFNNTEQITIELEDGTIRTLESTTDETKTIVVRAEDIVSDNTSRTNSEKTLRFNTVHIPNGRLLVLLLSDSTRVTINSGSSLRYPVKFLPEMERKVFLVGEAFFEVSKDAAHPFIVETSSLTTEVLGTEFNVSSYPESHSEKVVLLEGKVAVKAGDKKEVIRPNTLVYLDEKEKKLSTVKVDAFEHIAWTRGVLLFHDEKFENIIPRLERKYGVTITNKYPALNQERFNGRFRSEGIEEVLQVFSNATGFDFKIENKHIIINPQKKSNMK